MTVSTVISLPVSISVKENPGTEVESLDGAAALAGTDLVELSAGVELVGVELVVIVELEAALPLAVSFDVFVRESFEVLEDPLHDIRGKTRHAAYKK